MPRRALLSNEQRTRLFAVPVDHAEMAKHYVLSADDLVFVRTKRRSVNRLGFAVQLCLLRYPSLGMGPAEQPPEAMIAFVARQLGVRHVDFANYAQRDQTRREHAVELQRYLGLRSFGLMDWRLPSGRRGRGVGHGSWRTHRPGNARSSANKRRRAAAGDGARTDRAGRACSRAKENLRGARGRIVQRRAGHAREVAHGRSGIAPIPLRLAAGLFGVARALQHRRAAGSPRICPRVGNRSRAHRTHPRGSPRPADRRRDDHDCPAHRRSRTHTANGDPHCPGGEPRDPADRRDARHVREIHGHLVQPGTEPGRAAFPGHAARCRQGTGPVPSHNRRAPARQGNRRGRRRRG